MPFYDIDVSEKLLDKALSSLNDSVCIVDAKQPMHPILYANPAFEAMSGFSLQETLGQDYLFLNSPQTDNTELSTISTSLAYGQSCRVVLSNIRKSGQVFWNDTTLSAVPDKDGNICYFISVQKDISNEVQSQKIITEQITALENTKSRLEGLVRTDPLTGLYNKRYFELQFPTQYSIAKRNNDCITAFMVDIDYFKQYNDHYGHLQGDKCLKGVAQALSHVFKRTSDFVARFGGDEFIIYSVGLSELQAQLSAKNLLEYMKDLKIPHEKSEQSYITLSIGIASALWEHAMGQNELIERADKAMYLAKSGGRNKAVVY